MSIGKFTNIILGQSKNNKLSNRITIKNMRMRTIKVMRKRMMDKFDKVT